MRKEMLVATAVATLVASVIPTIAAGQDFKVVINDTNSTTSISKHELSKCLLKQNNQWINGVPMIPVDQAAGSDTRAAFSQAIHDRDVSAIKNYWQRQIFSGRAVPPTEKSSDDEVLDFVRANPGAVGYVSVDADLGSGVKVLKVSDQP